jgi:hypothetical protein
MNSCSAHFAVSALVVTACLGLPPSSAQAAVAEAQIVNLTSRSFDVFLRTDAPADNPALEVFLNADGSTPAAAAVTELQPLFTGSTTGDDYARRQANRITRASLSNNGNTLFRVSNCETGTAYYVRVRFGAAVAWPTNSTLCVVRTLPAAEWNGGALQYLVNLGPTAPAGSAR